MLNLRGRSRKRWAASRNQTGSSVAIAAAKILLQVLSSGVIAGAGSVSVNAMAQPRGRRRGRQRSSVTARNQGPDSEGFGLFFVQRQSGDNEGLTHFSPPCAHRKDIVVQIGPCQFPGIFSAHYTDNRG